jgi:SAM-dependent methyltransferase
MHPTASDMGRLFFRQYWKEGFRRILDIGSLDVNGSLRKHSPPGAEYIGIDLSEGPGVDFVLEDPYKYPFAQGHFDLIVSTSCFEHDPMFWLTFIEAARVLSPNGYLYINAPSNGWYHTHPWDNWRFYPDAALALESWARRCGSSIHVIESFIAGRSAGDIWNDCVMIFGKALEAPSRFVSDAIPTAYNVRKLGVAGVSNLSEHTEDMRIIRDQKAKINEAAKLLKD